jgi:hypothetical protein
MEEVCVFKGTFFGGEMHVSTVRPLFRQTSKILRAVSGGLKVELCNKG